MDLLSRFHRPLGQVRQCECPVALGAAVELTIECGGGLQAPTARVAPANERSADQSSNLGPVDQSKYSP
jgi:hypothetical protein